MGGVALAQDTDSLRPQISMQTDKAFVYSTGNRGIQPVQVIIENPNDVAERNIEFTVLLSAGTVIGDVDDECEQSGGTNFVFLQCSILQLDANRSHIMDFFIDGPLSTPDNGQILLQLSTQSDIDVLEQSDFEASLADGNRKVVGSVLTLEHVRDILYDGNNNTVPDLNEQIINAQPGDAWEASNAAQAVLDVLFFTTPAAETYLGNQLDSRVAQLLTSTNEVFRENNVAISVQSLGYESVAYSDNMELSGILDEINNRTDSAFDDVQALIEQHGADLAVLLHAMPSGTDEFCAFSSIVGIGRQGDFQRDLHGGRLLTVLDVGPDCIDFPDMATSFAFNMGIVPSRVDDPNGGTFSYSSGYINFQRFHTIAARTTDSNISSTPDVNRFSNPDILCAGLPCGIDETDTALGANAVLSLNQTRHVIDDMYDSMVAVSPELLTSRLTPTVSNGIDVEVSHSTVESGAQIGAYTEYQVSITNPTSHTLFDLNVTALHLDGGLYDLTARNYRYDPQSCHVSGELVTTAPGVVGTLQQQTGRLVCYIDSLGAGETADFSYFLQIDATPPALDEDSTYYHEIVAVNSIPQDESAVCLPVYIDLLDALPGSGVCSVVDQLLVATDTGTGFLDLEALPTSDGNFIDVPYLRLNDNSLITAVFQIINFGRPELELVSYEVIDAELSPAFESRFNEDTGHLSIVALSLAEAVYNVEVDLVPGSEPARFENIVLVEVQIDTE